MDMNSIPFRCVINNEKSRAISIRPDFKSEGIERYGKLYPDGRYVGLEVIRVLVEKWRLSASC